MRTRFLGWFLGLVSGVAPKQLSGYGGAHAARDAVPKKPASETSPRNEFSYSARRRKGTTPHLFGRRGRLAAGVAIILAAGCVGAETEDDSIVVSFWGMGREGEVVEALVPEFEQRNPGIRVRVQQIPWTAAHEKLLTAHVGEATPDVAQLGNTWVPEFATLNALEPLGAWVVGSTTLDAGDFFPGIWDTNVIEGEVFGIPWYVDTRVVFYRTDLLSDAGYEALPVTWEEWREAMRRMKEQMGPRSYPILLPTNEWPQPVILGMQSGGELLRDGDRYANFQSESFRRGFEFYVSLFHEGLAPAVSASEISNRYQEFADGNIASVITGPWEIGEFRNRLPPEMQDKWLTAPLPGPNGPGLSMAGGSSLVIFRDSEHKQAAWRFIEFLSQPEQQVRFYELTGDLPPTTAAWNDPVFESNPYTRAFEEQLTRVRPLPKVPESELIVNKVAEYGERAARGASTVDATLERLDREIDRLLTKRRWMLDREADRDNGG